MKCPWCDHHNDVKHWDHEIVQHLVVTIDSGGHIHVHGPRADQRGRDDLQEKADGIPSPRETLRKMLHEIYVTYELWRSDPNAQMRQKAEVFNEDAFRTKHGGLEILDVRPEGEEAPSPEDQEDGE